MTDDHSFSRATGAGQAPDDGETPHTEEALEELLSRPSAEVVAAVGSLEGDFVVLGAGGKMGPSLARMLRRGLDACGGAKRRVWAVARFSEERSRSVLDAAGIETIRGDLTDRDQVTRLPEAENVVFMAGQKFGTSAAPEATWAMNCYVPALIAERYPRARTAVFSTGCVYPQVPVVSGGSREGDLLEPVGDYASSCVGRERLFGYFSRRNGTPVVFCRLNYAIDLRYGVLVDIATKVLAGEPVDVTMGFVNVIWQGDACAQAIRCLPYASSPPFALNLTGPETLSVRALAHRFGELFGREPRIVGQEAETALLANASKAHALFGYPSVPLERMIEWAAHWLQSGGRTLGKPTHFETRDGKY
ncbi:MAG: NAD-dependent epimerase/dehydratase family protein [Armatimonadota bacterium]